MKRSYPVLALVAVVLAAVWWFPGRSGKEQAVRPDVIPKKAVRAEQVDAPARPQPDIEGLDRAPGAERVEAAPVEATTPPERPDHPAVFLRGTWIAVDDDGREHPNEDGSFDLFIEDVDEPQRVEVRAGAWEVPHPGDRWIDVARLRLGGQGAVPVGDSRDALSEGGVKLELRARWIADSILHVVDQETGAELEHVELVSTNEQERFAPSVDDRTEIVRDAASPIALHPPYSLEGYDATIRVWARAIGYAWGSIEVPRAAGGTFVLALRRGGALRVEIAGIRPPLRPFLRLRDPDGDVEDWRNLLYEQRIEENGVVVIESLRARDYHVALQVGHRFRFPETIDARLALVRPGETSTVVLDAGSHEPQPFATLSGQLLLPPEWGLEDFRIEVELVGKAAADGNTGRDLPREEMQVLSEESGIFGWSFPALQAGPYELRFIPLEIALAFTLPPEGRHDLLVEIPPPAPLVVEVVDERTGEPVEDVKVSWIPDNGDLQLGGSLTSATERKPGVFSLEAPVGPLEIWCFSKTYRFRREVVDHSDIRPRFRVETRPAEGVLLRVHEGETALAFVPYEVALAEIDGEGKGWLVDNDPHGIEARYVVEHPGAYRFQIADIDGYRPILPIDVVIPEGTFVEVVCELERP